MIALMLVAALLGQAPDPHPFITGRLVNNTYQLGERSVTLISGKWSSSQGDHKIRISAYILRRSGGVEVVLVEDDRWFHWVILDGNFVQVAYSYLGSCTFLDFVQEGVLRRCEEKPVPCPVAPIDKRALCYLG